MKFEVESGILKEALLHIIGSVDKKNLRPILSNSFFSLEQNKLIIMGSDLEVSAKTTLKVESEGAGKFCLNARNLMDIIRELPSKKVTFILDKDNSLLKINCEEINYSLIFSSAEEFPKLKFLEQTDFSITSSLLNKILQKNQFAMSTDETRPYMNGIYFHKNADKLRSVATDGHRLALYEIPINKLKFEQGFIIPRKGVSELRRLTDNLSEESIELSKDESFLYVKTGSKDLSIRLVARDYPKYQAVIPQETKQIMTVKKSDFLTSVKRVKIVSSEKFNGIKLHLETGTLTLSANHPNLGSVSEKVAIDYTGEEFSLGVNAKYLLDVLSVLPDGEVTLKFNTSISPIIIYSDQEPEFLSIIMPMKI